MEFVECKTSTKSKLAVFEELSKSSRSLKRPRDNNDFDSDSYNGNLIIDDDEEDITTTVPRKKVKNVKFDLEKLDLKCMWSDCKERHNNFEKFIDHIYTHLYSDDVKCLWNECDFEATNYDILRKHLSYHCYLARLYYIGQQVIKRLGLPECHQNPINPMPEIYNDFKCEWDDCNKICPTYHEFLFHVTNHVHKSDNKNDNTKCLWRSCNAMCKKFKLSEHMHTHTKQKRAACPTCFATFVSNAKFGDHRKRQMPAELLRYQCCTCSKLFPGERLLREHIKVHINHYKCSMCEMTCPSASMLLKHMRYRHLNDRPHECHLCKKRTVTKGDLNRHLIMIHSEEDLFACEECDFKCRTQYLLDVHYRKAHDLDTRGIYECHCCQARFREGRDLTKHLKVKHDYLWPPGHSKFRYTLNADGIHRLQTVRYESLELTEEMMSKKMPEFPASMKTKLEYSGIGDGRHMFKIVFVERDDNEDPIINIAKETEESSTYEVLVDHVRKVVRESTTQIEIVVEDLDVDGKVIKSETIKSKEIICLQEDERKKDGDEQNEV